MLGTNGGGFFQRQQRPSIRKPDTAVELRPDWYPFSPSPRASPGTYGRMARDQRQGWALWAAMAVLANRRGHRSLLGRVPADKPCAPGLAQMQQGGRQPWKGRDPLSGWRLCALPPPSPPMPPAAPVNAMQRQPDAAGRSGCRSSTSSWARSSSAASGPGSTECWSSCAQTVFIPALMVGRTPSPGQED